MADSSGMTQTRTLIALITGLVAGLLIAAGIAALVNQVSAEQPPAVTVTEQADADALADQADLAAQVPFDSLAGTDGLTVGQLAEIELAADRVCEGLTAGVPMVEITRVLSEQQGLTDEQARDFANEVGVERCYPGAAG
jgi:hypothetical protein